LLIDVRLAAGVAAVLCNTVASLPEGRSHMLRLTTLGYGALLACSFFVLAGPIASADDKKDKEKPTLSGVWMLKAGEAKIEFSSKNVMRIAPHGDSNVIVVICAYTVEKEGLVKAKVTDIDGMDDAKEKVKEIVPAGTEFSFKWKVTDDTAKLEDLKCDKTDDLKSHLEGEFTQSK
jgi:hypothetical protein